MKPSAFIACAKPSPRRDLPQENPNLRRCPGFAARPAALLALLSIALAGCGGKPQLQFKPTVVLPQMMEQPTEAVPEPLVGLCSAWVVEKNGEEARYAMPRDIRWVRRDRPEETLEIPSLQSWFQRNQQTLPGPGQHNERLKKLFETDTRSTKDKPFDWRGFLARPEDAPGDRAAMNALIEEQKKEGVVVGLVMPGMEPSADSATFKGVEFYRSFESLHTALAAALTQRAESANVKAELGRRRTAPVVPVLIVVDKGTTKKLAGSHPTPTPPPPVAKPAVVDGRIQIGAVPDASGASGAKASGTISGRVEGVAVPDACRVVLYSLADEWNVQPTIANPHTRISADGSWSATVAPGSDYAALLVAADYRPAVRLERDNLPKPDGKSVFALATQPASGQPAATPAVAAVTSSVASSSEGDFKVELRADKKQYRVDYDIMKFSVSSDRDCYVRVYCQRADGLVVQLLPNYLDPQPCFLKAGSTMEFPPKKSDWEIRVTEPRGSERIRLVASAIAFTDPDLPPGTHAATDIFPQFAEKNLREVANRGLSIVPKARPSDPATPASPTATLPSRPSTPGIAFANFEYRVE